MVFFLIMSILLVTFPVALNSSLAFLRYVRFRPLLLDTAGPLLVLLRELRFRLLFLLPPPGVFF